MMQKSEKWGPGCRFLSFISRGEASVRVELSDNICVKKGLSYKHKSIICGSKIHLPKSGYIILSINIPTEN